MEDIEMPDAPTIIIEPPEEENIRSPRTPTFVPDSPSISSATPFDATNLKTANKRASLPAPPSKPLAWIWQCHLCHSRYPLGVTRRCLIDGHYYCSGEGTQPNIKKRQKPRSCSSEFDYVGWRDWGAWRRKALANVKNPPSDIPSLGAGVGRGCELCEFPSQCRYNKSEQALEEHPSQKALGKSKLELTVDTGISKEDGRDKKGEDRYYNNGKDGIRSNQAGSGEVATKDQDTPRAQNRDIGTSLQRTKATKKKRTTSLAEDEYKIREANFGMHELVLPVLDMWTGKATKRQS